MFMLSFNFVIVRGLFECKQICAGFSSFAYMCIAIGDPGMKRGGLESHYAIYPGHICMPDPSQDLDFQRYLSWSFVMLIELKREVIVLFVDIG